MSSLLEKYNRPAPRYTSYPPVPFWAGRPEEMEWISHLKGAYTAQEGVDLYVHVPFCEKLCYYCGCNRVVIKNHDIENYYVDSILAEWNIYQKRLGFSPLVNSLHLGGGTPTFLSALALEKLISGLTSNKKDQFIGSVEIDPRTTNVNQLDVFFKHSISRVSLGIQDFDPSVQAAINRHQSFDLVEKLVTELRCRNVESINFDIIYGLPKQSGESISKTIDLVKSLRPDLIAYYSYAHLPDRLPNQRLIKSSDLPAPEEKQSLYEMGKNQLLAAGYADIGMDHFALPSNHLYQAKEKNTLHRNFMGYVDRKSKVLIGLGPSSISDSSNSFSQNEKKYSEYVRLVENGVLPIVHGHVHTKEDKEVQKIILDLMCKDECEFSRGVYDWQELQSFANDSLIALEDSRLRILPEGKKFMRNVAMAFDFRLKQSSAGSKFSQSI